MIQVMKGNLIMNGLKWFYHESDYRLLLCLEWVDERRFRWNEGNAPWKGIEEGGGAGWRITRLFDVLKGECRVAFEINVVLLFILIVLYIYIILNVQWEV
jgi:hypothetical protein